MPNWNDNIVVIEGPSAAVNGFLQIGAPNWVDNVWTEFSMDNFYPEPKDENGEPSNGWYGWRVDNWGCKWDIREMLIEMDEDFHNATATLIFQTPWGPNTEFWKRIAEDYKELTVSLSYYEGGMQFGGRVEWEEGKVVVDDEYEAPNEDGDIEGWEAFAEAIRCLGFEGESEYLTESFIPELIEEWEAA